MNRVILGQISPLTDNIFSVKQRITFTEYKAYKPKHLEIFRPAFYTNEAWKEIIDLTWGAGFPTEEKVTIVPVQSLLDTSG